MGWHRSNSGRITHTVGQKQPNGWGLYDMHGNVAEWCSDWRGHYPSALVTDPTGPASGAVRILRGGSRSFSPRLCRSADRNSIMPEDLDNDVGFRVALDAPR